MKIPRVSVVMPVWNPHPLHFRSAVQSVIDQTVADFELIIVEDPSPRRAADTLAQFDDSRIRHLVNQQRTSLGEQRNRGLAHARAEWIAIHDHDDVSEPDRLERQLAFAARHPEIAVLGTDLRIIDDADRICGFRAYPRNHESIVRAMPRFNPIAQPSVLHRRQPILEAGGYQYPKHPMAEDYDLWCRLALAGQKFANLPEPCVRYRIHPEGSKTTNVRPTLRGTIDVKRKHWAGRMDLRAKARLWAERLLLFVPPPVTLQLFMRTQYSASAPVGEP